MIGSFLDINLILFKSDIKIGVSCVSNRKTLINLGLTTVSNGAKFKKTITYECSPFCKWTVK